MKDGETPVVRIHFTGMGEEEVRQNRESFLQVCGQICSEHAGQALRASLVDSSERKEKERVSFAE